MNDGLDMYFGESLAHFEKAFVRQLADRMSHRYNNSQLDDCDRWLQMNSDALNHRARFQGVSLSLSNFERWCLMEHQFELAARDDAEYACAARVANYRSHDAATGIPLQGEL